MHIWVGFMTAYNDLKIIRLLG